MIVTFRSKAAGEVIMLGEHARPLLELAGKSAEIAGGGRGVFTAAQLPDAIARIEAALKAESAPYTNDRDPDEEEKARNAVSLKQRAFPLLDMMRHAAARGVDVTWE